MFDVYLSNKKNKYIFTSYIPIGYIYTYFYKNLLFLLFYTSHLQLHKILLILRIHENIIIPLFWSFLTPFTLSVNVSEKKNVKIFLKPKTSYITCLVMFSENVNKRQLQNSLGTDIILTLHDSLTLTFLTSRH